MTAEPDLPITDAVPAPTKIEPGNLFLWNWRQMQVYAQACVAHATAARDAEIEALRTLAGCAYQMAGFHDAPVVWLDRLGQAANGDPLPDPDTISDELLPYQPDASSEIEALRAEVERVTCELMDAITRADKLAEALRELRDLMLGQVKWMPCDCGCPQQRTPDGPHSVTWLRAAQQVDIAIGKAEAEGRE